MITIVYSTRTANPTFQKEISNTIGVRKYQVLEYTNNGEYSLTELYNKGLKEAENDIVVFCHDDIYFERKNWGSRLLKTFKKNDDLGIVGIAGSKYLPPSGCWWEERRSMVGVVSHEHEGKKWTNKYSPNLGNRIDDVVLVDGLFFAVMKDRIKTNFNEDIKGFHFYDIDFSFKNLMAGVKIGVTYEVKVTHRSIGQTNDEWEHNRSVFAETNKDNLPVKIEGYKTAADKLKFDPSTIGVAIVTYNAEHRLRESILTIPDWIENLVIVNDGTPYDESVYPKNAKVIQHETNMSVGYAKNSALKELMGREQCEHIFLIEDDILIRDENVFEEYIKHSYISGIRHLNFALHGPANKKGFGGFKDLEERAKLNHSGEPNPVQNIKYTEDITISLYPNCVGAFSYYHRSVIEKIGLFDKVFKNAWEHVEHTYRAIKNGFHPPFWLFADIANSGQYLDDIENSIENSTIGHTETWTKNSKIGMEHYKRKHGFYPTQTPQPKDGEMVSNNLRYILENRLL